MSRGGAVSACFYLKIRKAMKVSELEKLKVGDKIKFRTWNREGFKTGIRKIVSIDSSGIGVNFFGWKPFYLKDNEVIEKVID